MVITGCSSGEEGGSPITSGGDTGGVTPVALDTTPPELSVAFVDTSFVSSVIPFGAELNPGNFNPAYEIMVTDPLAQVFAATGGVIVKVEYNGGADAGQDDYEIWMRPNSNSAYLIIHDHVKNVTVAENDLVIAGDILGTVGAGGIGGRTELQINFQRLNVNDISVCPESLGTTAFNNDMEYALSVHNSGGGPIYASMCLQDEVQP